LSVFTEEAGDRSAHWSCRNGRLVLPEVEKHGAGLVAVSPQLPEATTKTAADNGITFPLLVDRGNAVAEQFGIVFTLPMMIQQMYQGFGVNLASVNGDKSNKLPVPATYLIGSDGLIVDAFVDVDHSKRMEPAAAVDIIKEL